MQLNAEHSGKLDGSGLADLFCIGFVSDRLGDDGVPVSVYR